MLVAAILPRFESPSCLPLMLDFCSCADLLSTSGALSAGRTRPPRPGRESPLSNCMSAYGALLAPNYPLIMRHMRIFMAHAPHAHFHGIAWGTRQLGLQQASPVAAVCCRCSHCDDMLRGKRPTQTVCALYKHAPVMMYTDAQPVTADVNPRVA
jgi:hypothetical protein